MPTADVHRRRPLSADFLASQNLVGRIEVAMAINKINGLSLDVAKLLSISTQFINLLITVVCTNGKLHFCIDRRYDYVQ